METDDQPARSLQRMVRPRCSICEEPAGHTIGNCPACQDREETEAEFLRVRKLLHRLSTYFGDTCTHALAIEVRKHLAWPNS